MSEPLVVVFTCNWNAYSGLETAGAERRSYPAAVRPLKVQSRLLGVIAAKIHRLSHFRQSVLDCATCFSHDQPHQLFAVLFQQLGGSLQRGSA